MFKKYLGMLAAGIVMVGLVFTGCGDLKEKEDNADISGSDVLGSTEDENNDQEGIEPALRDEAKKKKQFADPEEGELYAKIRIKDYGTITVKFFPQEAPLAVENFVTHARNGYYDGVTFHRIIDDFMIQGGDPDGTGMGGESIWGKAFEDEFSEELHPVRGALCMANAGADTNGSQFFIVQADAGTIEEMERLLSEYDVSFLEYAEKAYGTKLTQEQADLYKMYGGTPWLYQHHTVFGQVLDGYEVLDAVAGVKADSEGVPAEPVISESIEVGEWPVK